MTYIVADCASHQLAQIAAQNEDWIIEYALSVLERRVFKGDPLLESPTDVQNYLRLKLVPEPSEIFGAVFLDSRLGAIAYEPLFTGTISSTTVHPRVVVQRALVHNAAAVLLVHQHPSGCSQPSKADELLTASLTAALAVFDIRVVDHMIIGKGRPYSFAETGLL